MTCKVAEECFNRLWSTENRLCLVTYKKGKAEKILYAFPRGFVGGKNGVKMIFETSKTDPIKLELSNIISICGIQTGNLLTWLNEKGGDMIAEFSAGQQSWQ